MSYKKTVALAGMLVILGAGLALAQTQTKAGETNMAQNRVKNQVQDQIQTRTSTAARTPASHGEFGSGAGFRGGNSLGNAAFRMGLGGQGALGGGVCDGTGPKGNATRKGRG